MSNARNTNHLTNIPEADRQIEWNKTFQENRLKFGYTLYVRLSSSSDRNSRKIFNFVALDGKALLYSPLEIFEYYIRESST